MSKMTTTPLTEEETERLCKSYRAHKDYGQRYIRTSPGGQVLASTFENFKDQFHQFKLRPNDIFVFGWPKNGSIWLAEMVWCLRNGCDVEKAKQIDLFERFPFIDLTFMADAFKHVLPVGHFSNVIAQVAEMESPRTIRSHLCFDVMPPKMLDECKVLVVLRNPKDTIVSFYHHERLIKFFSYCGDFASYFDLFMDDLVPWSSYWTYNKEAWKMRNHPNMCLLFYEDMKRDLSGCIKKVAKFLQEDISKDQIKLLEDHLSFESMKDNPTVNLESLREIGFNDIEGGKMMRKGVVGDWRNYFTDDMNKRIDEAVEKHFKGTGLEFTYEL